MTDQPDTSADSQQKGGTFAGLNPDQLDAVVHRDGPLLVVAGAGSGKTRVLTHRIAHLIDEGVPPIDDPRHHVHQQGRRRDARRASPSSSGRWPRRCGSPRSTRPACASCGAMPTCSAIPRQFSIYDQADAHRLTGYVIRDLGLDPKRFTPRGVHGTSASGRTSSFDPARRSGRAPSTSSTASSPTCTPSTRRRLQKAGAMDFDDLLVNTVRLFREHPDVLEHYRERFQHILVDEYQDTNTPRTRSSSCSPAATATSRRGRQRSVPSARDDWSRTPDGPTYRSKTSGRRDRARCVGQPCHVCRHVTFVNRSTCLVGLVRVTAEVGGRSCVVRDTAPPRSRRASRADAGHVARLPDVSGRPRLPHRRTAGSRPTVQGRSNARVLVSARNQEHADAMWMLRVCDSVAEAAYCESLFAADTACPPPASTASAAAWRWTMTVARRCTRSSTRRLRAKQ